MNIPETRGTKKRINRSGFERLPITKPKRGREPEHPEFDAVEIGESFFIQETQNAGRVYSLAKYYGKSRNKKFVCRTVEGGMRVWRTK